MASPAVSTGISLRNLLFPTDFSPCAATALTYGVGLARRYQAALYTVTVVPQQITDYVQPPDPFYLRHTAEKKMANFSSLEPLQGIRHQEFVKEGFVAETVSDLISRLGIDLVLLSTHGRGGINKLVRGSVAEGIVNAISCPVLTVGPRVPPLASPQPALRRILCVINRLQGPTRALAYAAALAEQERAQLTVLHVLKISGDPHAKDMQSESEKARQRLAQLLSPAAASTLNFDLLVECGAPAEQILKVAHRQGADLIVMGRHQVAFAQAAAHLPWVTPYEVICQARCPVLTVSDNAP